MVAYTRLSPRLMPQVLLSAMEQGEVTVAKAGMVASLPARTALLAAANPQGGHYNRAKTLQVAANPRLHEHFKPFEGIPTSLDSWAPNVGLRVQLFISLVMHAA